MESLVLAIVIIALVIIYAISSQRTSGVPMAAKKLNKVRANQTQKMNSQNDLDFSDISEMGGIKLGKENNDTLNEFVDPQYLLPDNIMVQSSMKPFASSVSYNSLGTTNMTDEMEGNMFTTLRVEGLPDPAKPRTPMQHNFWKGDVETIPRQMVAIPTRADFQVNQQINNDWN